MRAIVVDDSRAMRTLLKGLLLETGFEIAAEAANGAEALQALAKTGPVELMLLDWNMPVMNGFDLLVTVRANAALGHMRLMMVTTETEASQILRALEAGADEYLIKPFSKQAIREKLELMGLFE
jgi:two-component system chemotaxis response regulator CheY